MDDFLRGSEDAKSNRLDVDVGVGHEMIANAAKQTVFPLQTWKNINDYTSSQTFLVSHGLFHFVQDASSISMGAATAWMKDFDCLMRLIWARQFSYQTLLADIKLVV